MAKGGYRKGAGRPKGTKEPQTLLREASLMKLRELADAEITPIAKALIEKAKTGDVPAIKELFDRAWGKAPQQTDITSDGKAITGNAIFIADFTHETNSK